MGETTMNHKRWAAAALLGSSAGLLGLTAPAAHAAGDGLLPGNGTETHTKLRAINNSGVRGNADVTVDGRKVQIHINARHLVAGMPHAMHFHFSAHSDHDCPTVRDDKNGDHRVNTAEGQASYGKIQKSLTTRGDTSPSSALAVNRFPTAGDHKIDYDRTIKVSKRIAHKIKHGKVAIVIHGIDYNQNGKYDFRGAGKSELDSSLPAEATDPVACGVLEQPDDGPLPGL